MNIYTQPGWEEGEGRARLPLAGKGERIYLPPAGRSARSVAIILSVIRHGSATVCLYHPAIYILQQDDLLTAGRGQ